MVLRCWSLLQSCLRILRASGKNFVTFPPPLFFSSSVNDHKRKQKVLGPNQKLKFNPTELIIYCKDFRIVRFRFDESGPESAKKVMLLSFIKFWILYYITIFSYVEVVFISLIVCVYACPLTCGQRIIYCSGASSHHVHPQGKTRVLRLGWKLLSLLKPPLALHTFLNCSDV